MAGIYIHIPFCKKACHYCDFHFSTSLKYAGEMVDAICRELALKKNRVNGTIGSIYFGGGTPSILPLPALQQIFDAVVQHYSVEQNAEITMEANPDDLSAQHLKDFRQLPVNRFSIGVQSFFNEDLLWMNRAHTAGEAEDCIRRSQDAGFENLSLDLIYGYPLLSDHKWEQNIDRAAALEVPHISSYSLTVENGTALSHAIKKGAQPPLNDAQSATQFEWLMRSLTGYGYDHYEISNFAKPGAYAVHNTNYWRGVPYLGIGPSAHGFDGRDRYINVANNARYLQALSTGALAEEKEVLSETDRYNEYIMTALRTMWGVDLAKVRSEFPEYTSHLKEEIEPYLHNGQLVLEGEMIRLSDKGKLYADGIAAELFALTF